MESTNNDLGTGCDVEVGCGGGAHCRKLGELHGVQLTCIGRRVFLGHHRGPIVECTKIIG